MLQIIEHLVAWADRLGQDLSPSRFVISPWIEVTILSIAFTAVCVAMLKFTLARKPFARARDKFAASSYAMLLYRRRPLRVFRGAAGVLAGSGSLLVLLAPAILISGGVLGLAWNTLVNRYGYGPLDVGRPVVVHIAWPPDQALEAPTTEPRVDAALAQVTAVVKAPAVNSVWLRLVPKTAGVHPVTVGNIGNVALNVSDWRAPALALEHVGPVSVSIEYPPSTWAGIRRYGWLVLFLGVCAVTSFPMARAIRLRL